MDNSYFSKENGVYILLEPDYPTELHDEAVFYDEDNEDNYEGFFDFGKEDKQLRKIYPN